MAIIATPILLIGDMSNILHSPEIIVDWTNDGTFSDTEAITSDVISMSWNRGKEPEQETTPTGTAVITVTDPSGNYAPNSTFFDASPGDKNVDVGREVRARTVYQGTTYPLFRGRISRIQPNVRPGNVQTATLFVVDGKEFINNKIISSPISNISSGGGSFTSGNDPIEGAIVGSTSGVIRRILDASSWDTAGARSILTQTGSTFEYWWTYGVSAKAALDEVERHEGKTAMIFVNSCGSFEFHSSTHRGGSTSLAKFGNSSIGDGSHIQYQGIQFEQSDRNVLNAADVTVNNRTERALSVQKIAIPTVNIANNSSFNWIVPLDNAPLGSVTALAAERDPTSGSGLGGIAIVGAGGTTYGSTANDKLVQTQILGGGSAIKFIITNTVGETVVIQTPVDSSAGASDSTDTFRIEVETFNVAPLNFESCDPTSITRYGRIAKSFDFPFFDRSEANKASARATEELAHNSTAHPNGISLTLEGSDSNSLTQVLTRDMNDRIEINSTATLRVSNQDFYITRGEWSMDPGGHTSVVWSLQEAT